MTIAQICLVIYLCCFVCSWGGLWYCSLETLAILRKEGYSVPRITSPFSLWAFLVCACPILNLLMMIFVVWFHNDILYAAIEKLKKDYSKKEE